MGFIDGILVVSGDRGPRKHALVLLGCPPPEDRPPPYRGRPPTYVAAEVVHESTVSRATASKYALLPNGEVIPYSHFFTPSLSIKDIMKVECAAQS
jgi:apolipoprotein N-acyltransferase